MDGGGARLPARAWRPLVPPRRLSGLSAAGLLLVVVRLRRLCAADLLQGRADCGVGWVRRDHRRDRHVGMARPRTAKGRDLWFGAMGGPARDTRKIGRASCRERVCQYG